MVNAKGMTYFVKICGFLCCFFIYVNMIVIGGSGF